MASDFGIMVLFLPLLFLVALYFLIGVDAAIVGVIYLRYRLAAWWRGVPFP